jgi:hypothetical protein
MLLLLTGGALLQGLSRQRRIDPGFATAGLLVAQLEDPSGIPDPARERAFTEAAIGHLAQIPGVRTVSVASMAPLTGDGMRSSIRIPGHSAADGGDPEIAAITAGPDLFATLGIPLRRGRELSWRDRDTLPKVIVNEAMARRFWGAADPIGSTVELGGSGGTPAEVIGVAADARFYSLDQEPVSLYAIQRRTHGGAVVLIRAERDIEVVAGMVRAALTRPDIRFALVGLRSMDAVLETSLLLSRAITNTLLAIGVVAVLLATIGLYGVVSYITSGRTKEFGIRLALGASRRSISTLVIGYGLRTTIASGIVGTAAGIGAIHVMQGMTSGAQLSFAVVAGVWFALAAVTLAACTLPALSATGIPPATALRAD